MENNTTKLKVAIADFYPLIMEENGEYKGFEIDLWKAIAKEIREDFEYEKHNFKEIIPLLSEKKADIGLAGITITEKREKVVDFSHPTLDSGLLITVNKDRNKPKFFKTIINILSDGSRMIRSELIAAVICVIIFGNLLWFAEENASTFNKSYFPGIFESFWLIFSSMSTAGFGDYVPHTWLGRIVIAVTIIVGFAIFGLLIAQVTSFMTVKRFKGVINNSRDLVNKKVATVEGSTSENILRKAGAKIIEVSDIDLAYQKLKKEEIDAIVFDAPAVIYYEQNDKDDQMEIVGELFDKQKYGIAMQQGSPLREKINQAILGLKESGDYDLLYRKWFGEDSIMES